MWKMRCEDRHGRNAAAAAAKEARAEQIKREVVHLYRLKDRVQAEDRRVFEDNVQEHLQQDSIALSTWVSLNRDLILYSVRQAKKTDTQNVKPITKFYEKIPKGPNNKKKKRTQPQHHTHITYTQQRLTTFENIDYSRRTNHRTVLRVEDNTQQSRRRQTRLTDFFAGDHPV